MHLNRPLIIFAYCLALHFAVSIEAGWAMAGGAITIIGDVAGEIRLGDIPPKERPCSYNKNGLLIVCDKGKVKEVNITSSKLYISRSRLRVGGGISDIIRFYGKGDTKIAKDRIYIKYPDRGLDFEVDKQKEIIIKIRVYNPVITEAAQDYKQFKDQLKK